MNTADSISFQSLHMIRDELMATIEQSARDLEVFVSSSDEVKSLNACVNGIRQIVGILKLLEFKGAAMLAEELLATTKTIAPSEPETLLEKQLELIGSTFFVLSRYLEYVLQTERKIPVLLIPYINELRKYRREPLLPESFFFNVNLNVTLQVPQTEAIATSEQDFRPLLVRLRHMYQLGLLGILRDKQTRASLGLMRRALIRLQRLGHDRPLAVLWWMANLVVEALLQHDMEIIEPRKMLLSRIDRIIRQVQKGGTAAYQAAAPKGLLKELLYLLVLSGSDNEQVQQLRRTYGVTSYPFDDRQLANERRALKGPSSNTMSSLVRVLQTETASIKNVLETAAQGMQIIDDVEGFKQSLIKIAETLGMVGLVGPASILKQQVERVEKWRSDTAVEDEDLDAIAKSLLYVDSAIGSLETHAARTSTDTSEASQSQMIASSELAQAERIVLVECVAGISLTKRAITAYSESEFDASHIANIAKTLNTVRGGLLMLKRPRAAEVMTRCVDFVEEVLMDGEQPAALQEQLETFADAIISVEYYFDTASNPSRLDDSVLQVAEESLAALGYDVPKSV